MQPILPALLRRRPLLCAIGILVLAKTAFIATAILTNGMLGGPSTVAGAAATLLLMGLIALACYKILKRCSWASAVGFNPPARWRASYLIWLPALYIALNLSSLLGAEIKGLPDWHQWMDAAVRAISIPLVEESVFRGLILAILLVRYHRTSRQILGAVLLASVLFGLWHLPPSPNVPWQQSAANVVYTIFFGVGFSAVVLRTRSIWLGMLVHGLIVFANAVATLLIAKRVGTIAEFIAPAEAWRSALLTTGATLPLLLYGMWLLRDFDPAQLGLDQDGA